MPRRFKLCLRDDVFAKLEMAASTRGTDVDTALHHAIAYYSFIVLELAHNKGNKLSITDQNDNVVKDINLPS